MKMVFETLGQSAPPPQSSRPSMLLPAQLGSVAFLLLALSALLLAGLGVCVWGGRGE